MKQLVHIINHDKFTSGYVNFMYHEMTQWEHTFLFLEGGPHIDEEEGMQILRLRSYSQLLTDASIRRKLHECDRIVVDGVFGVENYLFFYPKKVWEKTLLYFWGGDFYQYSSVKKLHFSEIRRNFRLLSKWLHKQLFTACTRKCRGWIFLIPGDADAFREIIGGDRPAWTARMPQDPNRAIDRKALRGRARSADRCRILVGNSATASNHHREIFELLARYPREQLEVLVPLSYGNEPAYQQQVLREGRELLGEAFHPLTALMDKRTYVEFLADVDVGIFNNDRQQGMGNINILHSLGRKVYLRENTAMWQHYTRMGYRVFPVSALPGLSLAALTAFPEEDAQHNAAIFDSHSAPALYREEWTQCLG